MLIKISWFVCSALLMAVTTTCAWAIELDMPIRCDYGRDCFIQNYVDLDPSKAWRDYDCGALTYDGHKGTDFRVPWASYLEGVEVLAAADGVVHRVRDGVEDRDARGREDSVMKIGLGNAVVVRHSGGFQTVYAHMKKGSVRVQEGDRVKRGQALGLVGLSGLTTFSHLHFGVRHNGNVIGPFKGLKSEIPEECGSSKEALWSPEAQALMPYIPTGLLQAGFVSSVPSLPEIVRAEKESVIDPRAPVLVYAVTVFGVQAGDEARLRIISPSGELFAKGSSVIPKNQAQRILYAGKKLSNKPGWPSGTYRGEFQLIRNGKAILTTKRTVLVK